MNCLIRLLSAILMLISPGLLAESTSLGIGVGISQQPYKQYRNDISFLPVIDYDHQRFWFHGIGGGYKLWTEEKNKFPSSGFGHLFGFVPVRVIIIRYDCLIKDVLPLWQGLTGVMMLNLVRFTLS